MSLFPDEALPEDQAYKVLARKYRPTHFAELIGQDALVRTLSNAIKTDRVAHAFMLTGVRGVGKTTTARIIAKALNYTGADGTSGPTIEPTDDCAVCRAITADRHPDVIEMDAASNTGVDNIREILDGVRYAPSEARYKIYIIDEVHMLSKSAFNALLKTLEEPPEHVKFIFATTEIRKVPVTVLSRCQRFDLKRVDIETLTVHFTTICEKENVKADQDALALISRAADGSVRDGLSLLDQAIALSDDKAIDVALVKDMLGLADRAVVCDAFEATMSGAPEKALEIMQDLFRNGAEPSVVIQDMLDLTHRLCRYKVGGGGADSDNDAREEKLAKSLPMSALGKAWQVLLKGLQEIQSAPVAKQAAEMAVMRLAYAADLPDPSALVKQMNDNEGGNVPPPAAKVAASGGGGASTVAAAAMQAEESVSEAPVLASIQDIIALLEEQGEPLLAGFIRMYVRPVQVVAAKQRLEVALEDDTPADFVGQLTKVLRQYAGEGWVVVVSSEKGGETINQAQEVLAQQALERVQQEPIVKNVLESFPGAKIIKLKEDV